MARESAWRKQESEPITSFEGTHRFLGNQWHMPVELDGRKYASVEHAFQAARTLDPKARQEIHASTYAVDARRVASNFMERPGWSKMQMDVMRSLLSQKFAKGSRLADRLLATGDADLVWTNHLSDSYWGVSKGVGENHLGRMLMSIRSELERG